VQKSGTLKRILSRNTVLEVLDHCPADAAISQNLPCSVSSTIMAMDPDDSNPASSGFVNQLILGLGMLDLSSR
jgi:hypothetical protein